MRIGFVTQLLWDRYGPFWTRLLEDAGATVLLPDAEAALDRVDDPRAMAVPARSFRLAVAQALSMPDVDLIVAPALNDAGESPRGGGQDPWIADFPAALATVGGLPPVLAVPARLDPSQEGLAVEILQQITRNPAMIRRIWDRHRAGLAGRSLPEPGWSAPPGTPLVGVLGQPWLLGDELAARVTPQGARSVAQHRVDTARLREEGSRLDERLIATDLEVLGAARLFGRRGTISELHLIVDERSGSDAWLRERVSKLVSKPLVVHELGEILGEDGEAELLRKA